MALITYTDKDSGAPKGSPEREWTAENANEVKAVVNANAGGGPGGGITGPATSIDEAIPIWNGITGGMLKDSGKKISTDGTMAANSDAKVPTEKALVTYITALLIGLWDDRGNYDASVNTFPATGGSGAAGAILKGDIWTVSVAGTLGAETVNIGDTVRALVDTPGQTASNWAIGEANINALMAVQPNGLILKGSTFDRFYGSWNTHYAPSTTTSGVNALRAMEFPVTKTMTLDTIQAEVTTLVGGSNFRLGVYADNGNCYPGVLLLDTGNLSGAANAVVPFAISPGLVLTPGLYWLVIVSDASITFRAIPPSSGASARLGRNSSMGLTWRSPFFSVAHTYGALPNPFTSGGTVNATSSQMPEIEVRASS